MMKKTVLIRGVDDGAYRRAKSAAALRGVSIGRAVSDALSEWAKGDEKEDIERELKADRSFVRSSWAKLKGQRGKAVVVSGGKLRGVFESYEEARGFSSRFKAALTFVVEETPVERELEIGPDLEV